MYYIALGAELLIQDFLRLSFSISIQRPLMFDAMFATHDTKHENHARHDNKLVAEEMALNVHTRARMRAAETEKVAETNLVVDRQAVLPVITEEAETV